MLIHDCAESYQLIPAERPTIERALDLTQQYYLRGHDALQLACAIATNDVLSIGGIPALTFLSADNGLCSAASAAGLKAENPGRGCTVRAPVR